MLSSSDVFGLNTELNPYSYVDRGQLDGEIAKLASRNQHICLKGESKSGKSWLRQRSFPDAIVVQCRIEYRPIDIFKAVLASIGIELREKSASSRAGSIELVGTIDAGWKIIAEAQGSLAANGSLSASEEKTPVGKDLNDLEFICNLIKASGKRVVVEDFHYLTPDVQRHLAHDLKAMWDYGVYWTIIGVWVRRNYLTYLNPDLAGRIREISVYWSDDDLRKVISQGSDALNVDVSSEISNRIVGDSFGNVGLLQSLMLGALDESGIAKKRWGRQSCNDMRKYEDAALIYAEQLEAVFLEFARRVSSGIRKRRNATGIYAHAMWAVFDASDEELISGVPVDTIFDRAHARQSRIQKGNLKSILPRIDGLQVDDRGKGLVVTFVEQSNTVAVVDRTVLFYRKYCTVAWPWQEIADQAGEDELAADAD